MTAARGVGPTSVKSSVLGLVQTMVLQLPSGMQRVHGCMCADWLGLFLTVGKVESPSLDYPMELSCLFLWFYTRR